MSLLPPFSAILTCSQQPDSSGFVIGTVGVSIQFTIKPATSLGVDPNTYFNAVVEFAEDRTVPAGSFSPGGLSWTVADLNVAKTFTYTPAAIGRRVVRLIPQDGVLTVSAPIQLSVSPALATSLALTGPSQQNAGLSSQPLIVTPNGVWSGVVSFSDGAGGQFFPPTLHWGSSNAPQQVNYQSAVSASGTVTVTATATPSITITNNPLSVTITAANPIPAFGAGVHNWFYNNEGNN